MQQHILDELQVFITVRKTHPREFSSESEIV